jgi:hypothetical protein
MYKSFLLHYKQNKTTAGPPARSPAGPPESSRAGQQTKARRVQGINNSIQDRKKLNLIGKQKFMMKRKSMNY